MIKKCLLFCVVCLAISLFSGKAEALWVWTPESNQWRNPKHTVKDTPQEQLDYALLLMEKGEYKDALNEFQKLLKHYPRAKQAPDAQYYIGRVYEEQSKPFDAFKQFQQVVDKYPFSERSPEIVERQYNIGVRIMDGRENVGMFSGLSATNHVVEIFEAVIKNAPYGKLAAPAQYKIGLYYMNSDEYQEARDAFEKVINDYPESQWASVAKYQIALSDAQRSKKGRFDQKITESAVQEFKDFVKEYPEAELTEDAKQNINELKEKEAANTFQIAQFYEKQKNFKAAKIYYQSIIDDYTYSTWSSKALEKIRDINPQIK